MMRMKCLEMRRREQWRLEGFTPLLYSPAGLDPRLAKTALKDSILLVRRPVLGRSLGPLSRALGQPYRAVQ